MRIKRFCPICKKPVFYEPGKPLSPAYPFCSERCRLRDLGKWIEEEYRIPRPLNEGDDPGEIPIEDPSRQE